MTLYAGPTAADLDCIPAALKELCQWVLWRGADKIDRKTGEVKLTKIPYSAHLRKASSTNADTWSTYARCVQALPVALEEWQEEDPEAYRGGGLGYVFAPDDPYCGIDLDHVRDATTGDLAPWAQQLIHLFASYTEISPTGTGAHILVQAILPGKGYEKSGYFGFYDRGRYFTMTGEVLSAGAPLMERQRSVEALYTAKDVLIAALQRYGERYGLLFAGRWQEARDTHGQTYPSQSEADLAFCAMGASVKGTGELLDTLMHLSGLDRQKWSREDYRTSTLTKAIEGTSILGQEREKNTANRLSSYFARNGGDRGDPHKTSSKRLNSLNSLSSYQEWPEISPEAFYGVAGVLVNTLSPHSESDPVALLLQLLTYFGAVIGRRAYYQVEATRHYANVFTCLVGPTGKGRKGTAHDHIAFYMRSIDTSWTLDNISGGCGSGEGLIYAVRDAVHQREPIREKKRVVGYQDVETDQGVIDKRLLVYDSEFAGVLKVAQRDGNLLSVILRQAWDSGNLRNTVKSSPLRATDAHISVLGHITIDELQRYLTETEMGNGFANRILWPMVRRAQMLPDGGALDTVDVNPLLNRLREVFTKAREIERMRRDEEATAIWRAVYAPLSEGKPGLVGAILARGEAQALRLSMLYALLDGSATIQRAHLNAALAVWEYCEASAWYIFGTASGDATADTLLTALEAAHPEGLARKTVLEETFQRNVRADELDRVINLLVTHRRITVDEVPPERGIGRPKTILKYLPYELNELNELNQPTYLSLSNDAVKSMGLSSYPLRAKYELSRKGKKEGDPVREEFKV